MGIGAKQRRRKLKGAGVRTNGQRPEGVGVRARMGQNHSKHRKCAGTGKTFGQKKKERQKNLIGEEGRGESEQDEETARSGLGTTKNRYRLGLARGEKNIGVSNRGGHSKERKRRPGGQLEFHNSYKVV